MITAVLPLAQLPRMGFSHPSGCIADVSRLPPVDCCARSVPLGLAPRRFAFSHSLALLTILGYPSMGSAPQGLASCDIIARGHALIRNSRNGVFTLTTAVPLNLRLAVAWPQPAGAISPCAALVSAQSLPTIRLPLAPWHPMVSNAHAAATKPRGTATATVSMATGCPRSPDRQTRTLVGPTVLPHRRPSASPFAAHHPGAAGAESYRQSSRFGRG